MTDRKIEKLVLEYRRAIEKAHDDEKFIMDITFKEFPYGSCGDASFLLAEYLRRFGVETIWYSAERDSGSHAWLVVRDERVRKPTQRYESWPKELWGPLRAYGVNQPEDPINLTRYEEADLSNGLIIDITADQFEDFDQPAYVGGMDSFHNSFEFTEAYDYEGLGGGRLNILFRIVAQYLEEEL